MIINIIRTATPIIMPILIGVNISSLSSSSFGYYEFGYKGYYPFEFNGFIG
jgi:hypothetical protein